MMDYRYQVNITKPDGAASFRVSWQDMEKQVDTSFEVPASPVMKERLKSWNNSPGTIFHFLLNRGRCVKIDQKIKG